MNEGETSVLPCTPAGNPSRNGRLTALRVSVTVIIYLISSYVFQKREGLGNATGWFVLFYAWVGNIGGAVVSQVSVSQTRACVYISVQKKVHIQLF